MALAYMTDGAVVPNYICARTSRSERLFAQVDAIVNEHRRALLRRIELRWQADGTLKPGELYIPTIDGQPVGGPMTFVEAQMAVWPANVKDFSQIPDSHMIWPVEDECGCVLPEQSCEACRNGDSTPLEETPFL